MTQPLLVSAAMSIAAAIAEIGKGFPAPVQVNAAAAGALLQQIRQGAPVDVFIPASPDELDTLAREKRIELTTRTDIAGNRLRFIEDRNNSSLYDAGDRMYWMALEPGTQFAATPVNLDGMGGTVTFVRPKTVDGYPSVIFRRNGAASSDGAVFFTSKPTDPGSMRAVAITQSTGRADPYKYTGSTWIRAGA